VYVQGQFVPHHVPYAAEYLAERGFEDLIPSLNEHNPPVAR
jgi:hypothetical protein